jgi:hypothetical protein
LTHEPPIGAPAATAAGAPLFPETTARLERWRADPEVLGVLLVGSKSRGFGDELSDDDLEVVMTDHAHASLSPSDCIELGFAGGGSALGSALPQPFPPLRYDAQLLPLDDLVRKPASPLDLDHWPYERAVVLFDRDGRVAAAVAAAGAMDPTFRRARLSHASVDGSGAARRALKTSRRGLEGSARLGVARAARALLRIAFALESRWVPLDHWIERDLATLPDPERAGPAALQALAEGRPEPVLEALQRLEPRLVDAGVPPAGERLRLFFELVHPTRAAERAVHALP